MGSKARIAIIGAGLTGLTLAHALKSLASVTVLEKSRGLGGRMSTRRAGDFAFDHGAQYFSAKGADFANFLAPHIASGVVQPWAPRRVVMPKEGVAPPDWSAPRYVAVPGMTALAKTLADGLTIERTAHVERVEREHEAWRLVCRDAADRGRFDWVICTAPAIQTSALMPDAFAGHQALTAARMQGCYSLMLGFAEPLALPWDAAWVREGPLAWIAVDTSKPGRSSKPSVVAQASNLWAEANLERDQGDVQAELCAALSDVTGQLTESAAYVSLHRWRYANVTVPATAPFILDEDHKLAAAGDWCGSGKVEAAFDSASALSVALRGYLT